MADELKRCPFCGDEGDLIVDEPTVTCQGCACTAYEDGWNTRPIEDALRAEVAALKAKLACYTEPLTSEEAARVWCIRKTFSCSVDGVLTIDEIVRNVRGERGKL